MGFGLVRTALAFGLGLGLAAQVSAAPRQMENLSRGLVAANVGSGMLVSWRLLGTDAPTTEFNLYRDGTKIASIDGKSATNYLDASGKTTSKYTVAAVVDGKEGAKSGLSFVYDQTYAGNGKSFPYKTIKVQQPGKQTMPDGSTCTYEANDMSVGDLDGDGELELILKWYPSNAKDNSQSGYTGTTILDAYKMDGTRMWRIDLGRNIRSGAHYTQFMVYDLDGDGKAEIAMKTSDGTVDGAGKVIGDKSKDYRTSTGTIMSGNEFLTVFNGQTGAAITTIDYVPGRNVTSNWGDKYGNRSERMLAAIAYLDGVHPSLIMCRGYYTNAYVVAYDFDGKQLKQRWYHKSEKGGQGLHGQGNHNISVSDIDGDGKDEIVYGSAALKSDGTLLYRTGLGHGDAMHLSDLDPDRPGLELWDVHEETGATYSDEMRDNTGKIIFGTKQVGKDNGRGMAADIDADNRGFEMWSSVSGGIYNCKGTKISTTRPSMNFRIYFSEDLQDELLDGTTITKWNTKGKKIDTYFNAGAVNTSYSNNGTKSNPGLVADILGDWREELILRSSDASKITIFSTPVKTNYRLYTLMHDSQYRVSIAWQNVAYNQPPHASYYLPDMVKALKQPSIYLAGNGSAPVVTPTDPVVPEVPVIKHDLTKESFVDASAPVEGKGVFEKTNAGFEKEGYYNFDNAAESYGVWKITSEVEGNVALSIHFANGGKANRDMNLSVNGGDNKLMEFPTTSDWTTWTDAKVTVSLKKGENTIKLSSVSADGGPNVDGFYFDKLGIKLAQTSSIKPIEPQDSTVQVPSGQDTTIQAPSTQDPTAKDSSETSNAITNVATPRHNSFNPITGTLQVSQSGMAEIYLYDMRGNMVAGLSRMVSAGETSIDLKNEPIAKGSYLVVIKLNSRTIHAGKFLK